MAANRRRRASTSGAFICAVALSAPLPTMAPPVARMTTLGSFAGAAAPPSESLFF
ncbi:hypothetical protein ACFDR9_003848 [Janthinobacterium sp. CG_23.3]|uniref:hypothetical protein n=1 Tax=Janthinobacterium sp. CG_23.3 TaxID=3349634 RepID=UPI0038D3C2CE